MASSKANVSMQKMNEGSDHGRQTTHTHTRTQLAGATGNKASLLSTSHKHHLLSERSHHSEPQGGSSRGARSLLHKSQCESAS